MITTYVDSDDAIPLPNINGSIMDIVLKYAKAHENDAPGDEAKTRTLDIDEADAELIDIPKKALFDVILAANYLDFTDLLDLGKANLSL